MHRLSFSAGARRGVAAAVLLAHALLGVLVTGLSPGPRDAGVQRSLTLVHVTLPRLREAPPAPEVRAASARVQATPQARAATAPAVVATGHALPAIDETTNAALPLAAPGAGAAEPTLAATATANATAVPMVAAREFTPAVPQPPAALALQQARPDHDKCPPAPYPALLRDRGIEGLVRVQVRVTPQGRAAEARVVLGSGWRLFDEAAVQRALACRFLPARSGESAVEAWVDFPVRFALLG